MTNYSSLLNNQSELDSKLMEEQKEEGEIEDFDWPITQKAIETLNKDKNKICNEGESSSEEKKDTVIDSDEEVTQKVRKRELKEMDKEERPKGYCKYQLRGFWKKGDEWPFSHSLKTLPCKYLHSTGRWINGANWAFSHERLDHEQILLFMNEHKGFLNDFYNSRGYTNLGEYYTQFKNNFCENQNENLEKNNNSIIESLLPECIKSDLINQNAQKQSLYKHQSITPPKANFFLIPKNPTPPNKRFQLPSLPTSILPIQDTKPIFRNHIHRKRRNIYKKGQDQNIPIIESQQHEKIQDFVQSEIEEKPIHTEIDAHIVPEVLPTNIIDTIFGSELLGSSQEFFNEEINQQNISNTENLDFLVKLDVLPSNYSELLYDPEDAECII